jgi:hypothetical protein
MTEARPGGRPVVGQAVFAATLAATLAFFWWFLIVDHGSPPNAGADAQTSGETQ